MPRPAEGARIDERAVRQILDRYACPVPYHEVRARFLGSIATPVIGASPVVVVQNLWGGELPEFESLEAANELIGILVNGLWNGLTRHQKRTEPFRVIRLVVPATREGIAQLALTRRQEVDGFVEGLFAGQGEIDLPDKSNEALNVLGEIRAMMDGVHVLATDESKPAPSAELEKTLKYVQQLSRTIEQEMNAVLLDCTRARRAAMRETGPPGVTRH
ncbi:hypothetical protein BAL199_14717 [alpha proteobacterium BAL199]|nr:hypothetical protein BAL199_14717 [alpha proteobacterium BAL199]